MDLVLICLFCYLVVFGGIDCVVDDFCVFGECVVKCGLCVGFEVLVWGCYVNDYCDVWEIVCCVDYFNVGLIVDSFYMLFCKIDFDMIW